MSPAMPLIEIRRHAERADPKNNQGSLSEAGRAMATLKVATVTIRLPIACAASTVVPPP